MSKSDVEAERARKLLKEWAKRAENKTCADCSIRNPSWASTNLGVLLCISCSGVHRNLGVHISFVKSINLDTWNNKFLKRFTSQGGNAKVNSHFEAKLQKGVKPTNTTDMRQRELFIRDKYQHRKWHSKNAKTLKEKTKKKKSGSKKRKKRAKESDSESSSDSEESTSSQASRGSTASRRNRRKQRQIAKEKPKPKKKLVAEALPPPTKEPDVPNLLNIEDLNIKTSAPEDPFEKMLIGFGPSNPPPGAQQPAPFINFSQNQPQQPQQQMHKQSTTDQILSKFNSRPQHSMQRAPNNVYTHIPGFNQGFQQQRPPQNFQQRAPAAGFQQKFQQRPAQGFNNFNQQGFQQQGFNNSNPQRAMGFQQPRAGFNQPANAGFGQQQQQSGFQQQQRQYPGFGNPSQTFI